MNVLVVSHENEETAAKNKLVLADMQTEVGMSVLSLVCMYIYQN